MKNLLQNKQLVVTLGLLYLAQGIPMGIAMDALPTFLRHDGGELKALAFAISRFAMGGEIFMGFVC